MGSARALSEPPTRGLRRRSRRVFSPPVKPFAVVARAARYAPPTKGSPAAIPAPAETCTFQPATPPCACASIPAPLIFDDGLQGRIETDLGASLGDYVIVRRDGLPGLSLGRRARRRRARRHDRRSRRRFVGFDCGARPFQRVLGLATPQYYHLPIVVNDAEAKALEANGCSGDRRARSAKARRRCWSCSARGAAGARAASGRACCGAGRSSTGASSRLRGAARARGPLNAPGAVRARPRGVTPRRRLACSSERGLGDRPRAP